MKTFLTLLAAMFMTVGVIGCGGGEEPIEDVEAEAVPPMDDATTAGHDGTEGGTEGGEEAPAE